MTSFMLDPFFKMFLPATVDLYYIWLLILHVFHVLLMVVAVVSL